MPARPPDASGPPRSRARRTSREDRRQALMDVAARLFAERGYQSTTVPDIVKAAGVGHGTFYEYFGSRRDILVAISEQAAEANRRRPEIEPRTLAERLRVEIYWFLVGYVENLALSKIWHVGPYFDEEIAETVHRVRRARTELFRRELEAAGLPPGGDAGVAATAITSMLEDFAYRWFVDGYGPGTSAADIVTASETITSMSLAALGLEHGAPGEAQPGPPSRTRR